MNERPTRLRRTSQMRQMVRETRLDMEQIIYPVFIVEGTNVREEITTMKDQFHFSVDCLIEEIPSLKAKGIGKLLLFASTDSKSSDGSSGSEDLGLVQRAIRGIKAVHQDIMVIADVCLCQYKSDGHCCIYSEKGEIDRINTLKVISNVALSYAKAGADMVAPSDMMDGRVEAIRQRLDSEGFEQVAIMAYSAKYASSYYGPFREAAHSSPSFGDRRSYQMDPGNRLEAIREIRLDLKEGADIIMIKPAMPYLDIIREASTIALVPVAAYQVSGEYAMLRNAVDSGVLDGRAIYESLIGIRRSGAGIIITYFAKEIKELLLKEAQL